MTRFGNLDWMIQLTLLNSSVKLTNLMWQVVTSSSVNDWLKDRWQAAMDMSGTPIEVCEGLRLGFRG
jgi:hypothetical protein